MNFNVLFFYIEFWATLMVMLGRMVVVVMLGRVVLVVMVMLGRVVVVVMLVSVDVG